MLSRRAASVLTVFSLAASWLMVPAMSWAKAPVMCHGHRATLVGTAHNEFLDGTAGRDVIAGLGGQDQITGGGGHDLICGGSGDDSIFLGDGDETVWAGHGDDFMNGGTGVDALHGGPGDDAIREAGGAGTEEYGDTGRDDFTSTVRVRIWAGPGRDNVELTSCVACVAQGGRGSDFLGTTGGERLRMGGGPGRDGITAKIPVPFPDLVLDGGKGADEVELVMTRPSDVPEYRGLLLDLGRGWVRADADSMRVRSFDDAEIFGHVSEEVAMKYTILGTAARNRLQVLRGTGFNPPVKLVGRGRADTLAGADGDDLIRGGPGHDRADGRFGEDTCVSIENARHCEITRP